MSITYSVDPNTRIIHELGMDFGASRVDVAVVNGIIYGYEIKSVLDTLDRLRRQMDYYNQLFERMTIVSSRKYYQQVSELVPKWWGIKIISHNGARLIEKRKGRINRAQDKDMLLKLLWKKELESFVDVMGYPKKMKRLKKISFSKPFPKKLKLELFEIMCISH